ncbi:hypothetical protein CH333_09130 [candidate division WOR-3 bacterium JGI_Cruoil_03_44_89]|uniref:Uncharacterized protein n=1 Tax=candidate division WOR-3 bacterium JGI_Cruoil_03_44_89 TaxID=1973748 RepID=A0A235BP15_UNCW3|nr:MAG: hypothetical protein CH333_09130 [candidate division WOR-3 bacterium JGI_Cruoil_03_44_89]
MRKLLSVLVILLFAVPLFCGTPEGLLEKTAEEILTGYSRPMVTAFGTAMGTDFVSLRHHGFLGFDVSAKLVWVFVPEEAKTAEYKISLGDTVWVGDTPFTDTVFEGNTIFGETEPIPGDPIGLVGLGFPGMFFAVPQANIGLIKGLNLSVRWCPFTYEGTTGQFLGGGLKYTTRDLLPMPLVSLNLMAGIGYQYFTLGDIVRANNYNGMAIARLGFSVPLLPVTFSPFAGVGTENTSVNLKYDYEYNNKVIKIDKTIEGSNSFRGVVGLGIDFLLFDVDVSYNIGEMNSLGLGIGVGIR